MIPSTDSIGPAILSDPTDDPPPTDSNESLDNRANWCNTGFNERVTASGLSSLLFHLSQPIPETVMS